MVQKEPLPNKLLCLFFLCLLAQVQSSCNTHATAKVPAEKDYYIDTSLIPKDTVLQGDTRLSVINGICFINNEKFSGILKELYPGGGIKSYSSMSQGMLYGPYKSFYEDGSCFEVRIYRNNLATGRHYGYWPGSNNLKFDYNYYEEKKEGPQKKWYRNGTRYLFANYVNDHEEGLQQGWRENGKLFLNYVVKDGYVYGLQQTALCYTLLNEKIRSAESEK